MLPDVLYNFSGTYDLISEINNIVLIVLEYQYFLNIGILYNLSMVKNNLMCPANLLII